MPEKTVSYVSNFVRDVRVFTRVLERYVESMPIENIDNLRNDLTSLTEKYGMGKVKKSDTKVQSDTTVPIVGYKTGDIVREARESKGYSQAELARKVSVDPSVISRLESNDRRPLNIAEALDRELGFTSGYMKSIIEEDNRTGRLYRLEKRRQKL